MLNIEDLTDSKEPDDDEDEGMFLNKENSLTNWKNPPKVSDLKQDYIEARSSHDSHVSKVNGWLDNLHVRGAAKIEKKVGRSSIVPRLIRKQAEWRYASLSEPFLSTDDLFTVDPVSFEDKKASYENQLILNYQFNNKINKIKFIDDYVRTAVDEGTVVVRVGWDYEEEMVQVEVPDYMPLPMQAPPMALGQQSPMMPMGDMGMPMQEAPMPPMEAQEVPQIQIGSHIEEQVKVIKNQPTLEVCDFRNIIIDPTCNGDLDKASFIIFMFETSLSELKKDTKYTNLEAIGTTEATDILAEPDYASGDESSFTFKDKPRQKFVAYEYWGYWDIDGSGIAKPIVATWVGNTMIRMEENPFPDKKLPFVSAQYLPVRRSVYGEPDGALLEDNQKIIGAVTRGMIDIMGRSANGQMAIRKDALDVTNRRKYDKGLDYEFNPNIDPRQAFYMHTYPEIPQSANYILEMQNNEAESLTGVKAFHSGISGNNLGKTAAGVRSAMDATSKRELGILRRLAEGVKQIGKKIISMNSLFLSDEEVIRVTNEEFVSINREGLAGEFDLKLGISTPESDNEKAQELAFMLQTTAQSMGPEFSKIILSDIAKLRRMPELAKSIEEYAPQPDPMQQKQAELQIALLEAQVMNERAKGAENEVDVQLKQAKTETEMARSRALHSDSDLKDLNFLEQESGRDVEKELQKKDHDRLSKLDQEAAKAALNPKPKPVSK